MVILSLLVLTGAGCGLWRRPESSQSLRIKGSDTMLLLVQRWAQEYMQDHQNVSIYAEGGGSALGIKALIDGKTDIGASSRPMLPEEIKQLAEKHGSLGISILCARDAISIYLHPDNPVRNLSLTQVRNIFLGSIRNWSEVGGDDQLILVVSRNPNSGTYLFLEQHVLRGNPYAHSALILPTTNAIIDTISAHVNAIGYGGMAYGKNIYHCRIDTISPTPENVRNGSYPLSRHLYFYTVLPPQGLMKEFVDWVLSEEGQRIVQEVGYIPLYGIP